jgi:hypothetical protein
VSKGPSQGWEAGPKTSVAIQVPSSWVGGRVCAYINPVAVYSMLIRVKGHGRNAKLFQMGHLRVLMVVVRLLCHAIRVIH